MSAPAPALCLRGFATSNYHNKIALALLEKGIDHDEQRCFPWLEPAAYADSPIGKVPFLITPQGSISESQAILEYLEDQYPQAPLYSADPFTRAKQREAIQFCELYVEWVARRLYPAAFFRAPRSESLEREVRQQLDVNLPALARLLSFAPFAMGADLSAVDCAIWPHLNLVKRCCLAIWNEDLVGAAIPQFDDYNRAMASRASVKQIREQSAADQGAFFAAIAQKK